MAEANPKRSRLLIVLAVLIGLLGLWVGGAGAWLLALGGSVYYLIAGLMLLATAWLLVRRGAAALWLFALLIVGTMAWAIWETGLDFWALAPRGDILVILGFVLALPMVVRRLGSPKWPGAAWPLVGSLGLAVVVAVVP